MPATRFGIEVARDPQLVFQIRRGRAVRPPMEAKILAYLDRAEPQPEAARSRGRRRR
jgi:hypothetical protein